MVNKLQSFLPLMAASLLLVAGCSATSTEVESVTEESTAPAEPVRELKTQHWCYASADFIAGGVPSEKVWNAYIADKSAANTVLLSMHLNQALNVMASQDESYHEDTVLGADDESSREALFDGIRFAQGKIQIPEETWKSLEDANAYCTDPELGLPQEGMANWSKLMGYISDAK